MKNSGVIVKSTSVIDLTTFDVYRYGGCSKAYLDSDKKEILKKFKDNQTISRREYIYNNILNLHQNSQKIDDTDLILPNTLFVDENGILEIYQMDYIEGICGINSLREYYMTKKYYLILLRLINIIKKYTNRNFIIEDLKLSNIIFDDNLIPHLIDNDFTLFEKENEKEKFNNFFIEEYSKRFDDTLKPEYNLFNLYFMVAMLLLNEEEFNTALSVKRYPSVENLKAINYFIQKNNGISRAFKLELRNLLNGGKEISFSEDIKFDVCEYILKRSKKLD